jgi:hypothetical protein
MSYKVAALAALGDLKSEVTARHAASAVTVVDRWVKGVSQLSRLLRRSAADVSFEANLSFSVDVLKELGGDSHRASLARALETNKAALDRIEQTLADRAIIAVETRDDGKHWRLL